MRTYARNSSEMIINIVNSDFKKAGKPTSDAHIRSRISGVLDKADW
jgi:hypothetical protein